MYKNIKDSDFSWMFKMKFFFSSLMFMLSVIAITSYYDARNFGATMEQQLKATYKNNENILSTYSLQVQEAVQVPAMYRDDLKEVVVDVMVAKYGEGGSKAVFQWFKDNNIKLDSTLYLKVQQLIESGRDKFRNGQTEFLDRKRLYETTLENDAFFTRGWWLFLVGYPRMDLNQYQIVSNDFAVKAFQEHRQGAMKLR